MVALLGRWFDRLAQRVGYTIGRSHRPRGGGLRLVHHRLVFGRMVNRGCDS